MNADRSPAAAGAFPRDAWQQVHVEAPSELTLFGRQQRGHLAVTVHNGSTLPLDPAITGAVALSYRLLGSDGRPLAGEAVRTPLSTTIPPGTSHAQKVTVVMPTTPASGIPVIRVGLVKEGEYWVEDLCPDHAATVRLVPAEPLPPFEQKMAAARQIWDLGRSNGLRWPYGSMMVAEGPKLFYIPVAKCACTSLKSMMVRLAGVDRAEIAVELGVHFVTDRFNTGVQLKDQPIDRAREILASADYFKFSVIRDPFRRLVSAYLEKFVYRRHSQRNLLHTRPVFSAVQGREDIDLDRGISFDQFLAYILAQDPYDLDAHWRPQHLYFRGVPHISRIFRLEYIGELERYLQEHHGVTIRLGHDNRTGRSDLRLPHASSMHAGELAGRGAIDPDSLLETGHADAIRAYYREDFRFYEAAP